MIFKKNPGHGVSNHFFSKPYAISEDRRLIFWDVFFEPKSYRSSVVLFSKKNNFEWKIDTIETLGHMIVGPKL